MREIDIEQELYDLVAKEQVLAFFNFVLPLPEVGEVEGLCKVAHPQERNSRVTYIALLFLIDAPDAAVLRAVDAHMRKVEWDGISIAGVTGVLPVPHRSAGAGLFLKEVDVYLEDSQAANAAFVRNVLQPAVARVAKLRPGELTVWEESAATKPAAKGTGPSAQPQGETLVGRLRRMVGL